MIVGYIITFLREMWGGRVWYFILTTTTLTIITATGNMSAHAYYNLGDGSYNGQVKKICLHPSYDSTTSVSYAYEIDIDM